MSARPAPRAAVALMKGYHSPQLDVAVRLNTNESPIPPPPEFDVAVARAVSEVGWNRYPDRSALKLRSAIAAHHGIDPAQVFAANGSNEVLQTLLLTYGGPDRTAAVFEPTYALHSHLCRVTSTAVVEGERADNFALDLDEVRRVVDTHRPAIVFLCSPNNPTGVVDPLEVLAEILELVAARDGLLCVDEAYGQFADHSALELLGPEVPLVITRTYSKTWAMAAARLGYLVGPEWVVAELEKLVLPYHLDAMTQLVGTLALDYSAAMDQRVATLIEERGRLVAALHDLPVEVWPSAANFVLFRPLAVDGSEVWRALADRSVLVRDCSQWPRLDGCLRVSVGTRAEDDQFITTLTEVLS